MSAEGFREAYESPEVQARLARARSINEAQGTGSEPRRYHCPNGHDWWTTDSAAPLVNIKCPNCGVTAVQLAKGVPDPHWQVQPLRTLEADIPAVVESGHDEQTECATCGEEVITGQQVKVGHGLIWHMACGDPPYDERTVKAVVEALRGMRLPKRGLAVGDEAADFIEERFKGDSHGSG